MGFVVAGGIAGAKVMLIFHYFIELNHAPSRLAFIVNAWILIVVCAVLFMPWIADAMSQNGILISIDP